MFKKLSSVFMALLIITIMSLTVSSEVFAETTCSETVCEVCDMNGKCHLEPNEEIKEIGSVFDLEQMPMQKVAPRSLPERCRQFPRHPKCPKNLSPNDGINKADDLFNPQKLKCQDAGTCDEDTVLSKLRRLLS